MSLTRYLGAGYPNTLLAESTSDSTVLDYLSINGLLAQYVQKAGRLPFGYPTGLLAKIAHVLLSVTVLTFKSKYQTKNKHGQQSISAIRAHFFMRIQCGVHTVYRIFFCPYPHRCRSLNILVSIQSAFNISADIFDVCISGYWIVPTFSGCFIKS